MRLAVIEFRGKIDLYGGLAAELGASTLDLDTVYWKPNQIAVQRDPVLAQADVAAFCAAHEQWVIEGCYASPGRSQSCVLTRAGVSECGCGYLHLHCCAPVGAAQVCFKAAQDERLEFLCNGWRPTLLRATMICV